MTSPSRSRSPRSPSAPPVAVLVLALLALGPAGAFAQDPYRLPPQAIVDILDAPEAPFVGVSPDRAWLVLAHRKNMPSLADMSEPMLRLAGRRINPRTNGSFQPSLITGLSVMRVEDGSERALELPEGGGWGSPSFAPDGARFAFTRTTGEGIELWVGETREARGRRLIGPELNGVRGEPCEWTSSTELLCMVIPATRGAPPPEPVVPGAPIILESRGEDAPVRTYQDLLEDPHDADLYDHYWTAQPVLVDVTAPDRRRTLAGPAVYWSVEPSPSGEYFLAVETRRPYSYLLPDSRFPKVVSILDRAGGQVQRIAELPLADGVPIGGVETGPRDHEWLPGEPHTLTWAEALDGGDPRARADRRDRIVALEPPFRGEPREVARTEFRFGRIARGEAGLTLVTEYDRPSRTVRTWRIDPGQPGGDPRLVWERNSEDRYGDPGSPVSEAVASGERLIVQSGDWIYLEGPGASDQGDRPFLDRMNVATGATERLFQSGADSYETFEALLDRDGRRILTRYESPTEPPNYYVRDLTTGERRALTRFADPAPQLASVTKEFLVYEREDGVQLSGTLYLPPEYTPGQRLPVVVWAYPREYSNADVAGQIRGSPNRFTRIGGASHLFFLTQGYAVFDGPTMPIVGGDRANDTYVEQLVSSARAAVRKIVDMGVADPDRIGVGGHSYGAFMTANLLAHSDLFRAGIARSGAYNRSLTPFGFQNEQRTFWEAQDVYMRMSPFMNAQKIDEPMLMIHGTADNNSGTFPIQSERMYQAMKGLGGTARLVMLPNESHGYRGRESVLHALAEMVEWFDRFLKNAPRRGVTDGP